MSYDLSLIGDVLSHIKASTSKKNYLKVNANEPKNLRLIKAFAAGGALFFKPFGEHWHLLKENEVEYCASGCTNKAEKCFGCEIADEYRRSKDPEDQKLAEKYRARNMVMFAVIDRNDLAKGVQLYKAPFSVAQEILSTITNPLWKDIDITDPVNGRGFTLTRTGTTQRDTRYTIVFDPSNTPLTAAELALIPPEPINLDELIKYKSYNELRRAMLGTDGGEEEADDVPVTVQAPAPAPVVAATPRRTRNTAAQAAAAQAANAAQPTVAPAVVQAPVAAPVAPPPPPAPVVQQAVAAPVVQAPAPAADEDACFGQPSDFAPETANCSTCERKDDCGAVVAAINAEQRASIQAAAPVPTALQNVVQQAQAVAAAPAPPPPVAAPAAPAPTTGGSLADRLRQRRS